MQGQDGGERVFPGADELTPSRSEYFSWINNTNEGATEKQTLVNLAFFKWLHDEYGMILDIYAFDAGAIDGPRNYYGRLDSKKFKRQFPNGWDVIYRRAKEMGTRLGVWGGPDGFGDTEEEARERIDLLVSLCRDYELALFKIDGVCGQLRPEKQDYFVEMMRECRKYSPDLILLNHRLELGKGMPYATTTLIGGLETYIDVFLCNTFPATHHRAGALSRPLPEGLKRLQEDHGVCLSSCLDYWDDDLVLQAFNRCLILAPQLYGNPWFLRDDEFPRLARIFNLHRRYRDILVHAKPLENVEMHGPYALSRGDGGTRFITLRNLEWEVETYSFSLDEEIGLEPTGSSIIVQQFHPAEEILGEYEYGDTVVVEVLPFRSCLIGVSASGSPRYLREVGVFGVEYAVVRDVEGKPVEIDLLGKPGEKTRISLHSSGRSFTRAALDGKDVPGLVKGRSIEVSFPGIPLVEEPHRKLADLEECEIPADVEALYEATCYAASNNCLEERAVARSGPTSIPEVKAARDAFFNQDIYKARGVADRFAFDGDPVTRWYCPSFPEAAVRIDLGKPLEFDLLFIKGSGDEFDSREEVRVEFSNDLLNWTRVIGRVVDCPAPGCGDVPDPRYRVTPEPENVPFDPSKHEAFFGESRFPFPLGKQKYVEFKVPPIPVRYIRLLDSPMYIMEVAAKRGNEWLDDERKDWHGTYLFECLDQVPVQKAWCAKVRLDEIPDNSYLCIPLFGRHGDEGAFAACKIDGKPVGAPDRAVSYPGYAWEAAIRSSDSNYTYYIPLEPWMAGKLIEIYVFSLEGNPTSFFPEAWITAYPPPRVKKRLVLE